MRTIMGIDQSLTSTGVVVMDYIPSLGEHGGIDSVESYHVIQTAKGNTDWVLDTLERSTVIADKLLKIIDEECPQYICIEAPSLGSKGNATRTLPMLLGVILSRIEPYLKERSVELITVAPTALKKFATNQGNCKKDDMVEAIKDSNTELYNELIKRPKSHGRYDIADGYWLAQWVIAEKESIND